VALFLAQRKRAHRKRNLEAKKVYKCCAQHEITFQRSTAWT